MGVELCKKMILRLWSGTVLVSLLFPTVASFLVPNQGSSCLLYRQNVKMEMAGNNNNNNGVTGSFFNPVPPPNDDNKDGTAKDSKKEEINDVFDFDQSMAELMRNRNKKSRASTPSTLGGVPTAKATGKTLHNNMCCNNKKFILPMIIRTIFFVLVCFQLTHQYTLH